MAAPGLRDSTALTPHAADLVAYEGGIGSNEDGVTGNALPDPEWTNIDWDTARVTVDNETWDVAEYGMPFDWYYADIVDGVLTPIRDSARIGLLQDDYLPDVLGSESRLAMLDAKGRAAPNRGRMIPGIPGNSPAGSLAWMTITGTMAGRPRTPVPR